MTSELINDLRASAKLLDEQKVPKPMFAVIPRSLALDYISEQAREGYAMTIVPYEEGGAVGFDELVGHREPEVTILIPSEDDL